MAIYVGDKQARIFRGDHKPVNMYLGSRKLAGWSLSSQTAAEPSWARTYNDKFSALAVTGATVQTVTEQGTNLFGVPNWLKGAYNLGIPTQSTGIDINSSDLNNVNFSSSLVHRCAFTIPIKVTPGLTYTVQVNITNGGGNARVYVNDYNEGAYTVITSDLSVANGAFTRTFTATGHYIVIVFGVSVATNNISFANIQLELGSVATEYESFVPNSPTADYPSYSASAGGILRVNGVEVATVPTLRGDGEIRDTYDVLSGTGIRRVDPEIDNVTTQKIIDVIGDYILDPPQEITGSPLFIPTHYPQTALTQDNAVKASITAAVKVAD